jgi:hypothetical protein
MTDDAFADRLVDIEHYAQSAASRPPIGMIPDGVVPQPRAGKTRTPEQAELITKKTVERYSMLQDAGKSPTHDDVEAEVIKELTDLGRL